jgi:pimeloyl-ACP methyl ester carboxylesterase
MSVVPLTVTVVAALLGWSDITVQPNRAARTQGYYAPNVAHLDRPSQRTEDTLTRYDLKNRFRSEPEFVLARLEQLARQHPDPDLVFALAELSWIEGRRLDRWRRPAAIDRFLDTVANAYDFLFDPDLADPERASDPRFRLACDLYNGGLERLLRAAQANGQIMPDGKIRLKVHGEEQVVPVRLTDSPWTVDDVDQLIITSDFEVSGLPTRSYQYGLGVPLIGVRNGVQSPQGTERFYPPEMAFPLTAFLVFNSRGRDPRTANTPPRACRLELVDPVRHRAVPTTTQIGVEADFSTPLAYMWSRTDLDRYRWTGLFRPGSELGRANLMLLRPYEPGKIPVVMVHGLISSPLAWIPMLNELLRDPTIQQRYQFLLFMYPTGVPVPIAAALLRDSLQEAGRTYNPEGRDPSFSQMVLLGHSMGGLLSHMMAVDSGNRLWQLNTDRRFEDLLGPPKVLEELRHYLFFDHQNFVRRVVFLATPHRGSDLSRGVVGRLGASLISEPDQINDLLAQLIKDNPDTFERRFRRLPSSIEMLDTDSPILEALLQMPAAPAVSFHSIIGSLRPGSVDQTTDGVVPYRSAHLDGVASELVVRSDHSVQKTQNAIREVHRILLEHLGAAPTPVRPPIAQTPDPVPALNR